MSYKGLILNAKDFFSKFWISFHSKQFLNFFESANLYISAFHLFDKTLCEKKKMSSINIFKSALRS